MTERKYIENIMAVMLRVRSNLTLLEALQRNCLVLVALLRFLVMKRLWSIYAIDSDQEAFSYFVKKNTRKY